MCYTIITKGKEKEIKKMYKVYYYRENEENTFTTSDLRTAKIVAYNEVTFLGCYAAYLTDNTTGEILKIYENR